MNSQSIMKGERNFPAEVVQLLEDLQILSEGMCSSVRLLKMQGGKLLC